MSAERNYRCFVQDYHAGVNDQGQVDLAALAKRLNLPTGHEVVKLGEARMRAMISTKLGAFEEQKHKTFIDEQTGQRRNSVPEHTAAHHNRLVDELYHAVAPAEPPAD